MSLVKLAISNVGKKCVILGWGEGRFTERSWENQRDEVKKLIWEVEAVLAELEAKWSEVEVLGVVVGPGAFSSLRVVCSLANALKLAVGVKLIGLDARDLGWVEGVEVVVDEQMKVLVEERVKSGEFEEMVVPIYLQDAKVSVSKKQIFT